MRKPPWELTPREVWAEWNDAMARDDLGTFLHRLIADTRRLTLAECAESRRELRLSRDQWMSACDAEVLMHRECKARAERAERERDQAIADTSLAVQAADDARAALADAERKGAWDALVAYDDHRNGAPPALTPIRFALDNYAPPAPQGVSEVVLRVGGSEQQGYIVVIKPEDAAALVALAQQEDK